MTSINVSVCAEQAKAVRTGKLTVGMVGVSVTFSFDGAWDGLKKIAVFRSGNVTRDRSLIVSETTTVPHEVLHKAEERLWIGVEGRAEDGTLVIPTTWADAGVVLPGANATGEEGKDPTPNAYDDIMAAIKAGALVGPQGPKGDKGDPGVVVRDISTGRLTPAEQSTFATLLGNNWLSSNWIKESNNLPGYAAWAYGKANVEVYSYLHSVHSVFKQMFDTANKAANGYKYKMRELTEENRVYFTMLVPGSYGGGTAMTSHGYEYTLSEEDYRVGDIFCSRFSKTLSDGTTTDKCYYMAIYIGELDNGSYVSHRFMVYIDYGDGVDEEPAIYTADYTDLCAMMGADSEMGTPIYYYVLRPENIAIADVLRVEKDVEDLQKSDAAMMNLSNANANFYGMLPISRGGTGAGNAANALIKLGAMPEYLVNYDIRVTADSKTLDEQIDDILWEIFDKNRENAAAVNAFVSVVCDGAGKDKFSLKAGGNRWMLLITKITSNYARVLAWCTGSCWVRSKSQGEWGEWCQENPPMEYGVEYRTTEKYIGKPVYTKLVYMGKLPVRDALEMPDGNWSKTVYHGAANNQIIRSAGVCDGRPMPFILKDGIPTMFLTVGTSTVTVYWDSEVHNSGPLCKAQIWYTK